MAAKKRATPKTPAQSARSIRRARATAELQHPKCADCARDLQAGEDPKIAETGGCIRCKHEQQFPGRDYDVDAAAAQQRGIRLASYLREQVEGATVRH